MDLDSLFKRAFDGFGSDPEPAGFPGFPGGDQVAGNGQAIASISISRCSRISRSGKEVLTSDGNSAPKNSNDFSGGDRAHEDLFKTPGNPGNPGKEAKELAETATSLFPEEENVPGNDREKFSLCEHHSPNSNHIASSPGDPLPISPSNVRAGVERELRVLADLGCTGPGALRDAVEIVAAKVRNAPALAERQWNGSLCHVCNSSLNDGRPVIAVLNPGGQALHLHGGECHDAHRRHRAVLVDGIMKSAGYGAETTEDAA